ncbi:MAG: bacillithiol biosynthesis cysteine-adding enzyme BshC [bacterium JZ-2024 1]
MGFEKHAVSWGRLPGTEAFTVRYLEGDPEVHRLFSGAPWDQEVVARRLAEIQKQSAPYREVAEVLFKWYSAEEHPRICAEIRHLREGAPVIITGQQPGLLGGPAYTLYKFLTTRALADWWSDRLGVHIVPVFWVGSEDSDLREMGWTAFPARGGGMFQYALTLTEEDLATPAYLYRLSAPDRARLAESLETQFPNADVRSRLREAYALDTLHDGFMALYKSWAESLGVILVPSHLRELRALALPVFERELETAGVSSVLVNKAGAYFRAFHMKPPIHKHPSHLNFYWIVENRREAMRIHNGRVVAGRENRDPDAFRAELRQDPGRMASGVVLRPIVQDYLFRPLLLVAGPSEIVYLPQLREVYAHFGVPFPLIAPRFSATVLTGKYARQSERCGLLPSDLFSSEGEVWQKTISGNRVARTLAKWEAEESFFRALFSEIQRSAQEVDPALASEIQEWAREFLRRNYQFRESLRKSLREREAELKDQVRGLCEFVRPSGKPQERVIAGVYFYAVEGEAILRAPGDLSPEDYRKHWLLKAVRSGSRAGSHDS